MRQLQQIPAILKPDGTIIEQLDLIGYSWTKQIEISKILGGQLIYRKKVVTYEEPEDDLCLVDSCFKVASNNMCCTDHYRPQ